MLFNDGDQQYQDSNPVNRERQTELQESVFHDQRTLADRRKSDDVSIESITDRWEVFLKMANTTVIITSTGQTIENYHAGSMQLANWTFGLNVERFLYKNHADRFNVQIEARNTETQEVICIHRYHRSPNFLNLNWQLNEAYEILQSLLTAIENRDGVWDAREQI